MSENNIQKQLVKLRKNKKLLWLGILFLVLVIMWILVSIFATTKTSTISQELRDLSKPFVPRLESKVFEEILTQRAFSDEELAYFSIFVINKDESDGNKVRIDIMLPLEEQEEFFQETDQEEGGTDSSSLPLKSDETTKPEEQVIKTDPVDSTDNASTTTPFIEYMINTQSL